MEIILPKTFVDKINQVTTRIQREKLHKLTDLMLTKMQSEKKDIVVLPKEYLVKIFNSKYWQIVQNAKNIGLIKEVPYGINLSVERNKITVGKKITYIPDKGMAKKYCFIDNYLADELIPVICNQENKIIADDFNLIPILKDLNFNKEELLNEMENYISKRIKSIVEIILEEDKLVKIKYQNENRMVYIKTLLKTKKENQLLIKEGSTYLIIDDLEKYKSNKEFQLRFHNTRNIYKLINKDFFSPNRNTTNNRLDYNLTNLPKYLLKSILLKNNLIEIDLSNSQFLILSYLLNKSINNSKLSSYSSLSYIQLYVDTFFKNSVWLRVLETFKNTYTNYVDTFSNDTNTFSNNNDTTNYVDTFLEEIKTFSELCFSGKLYQYISDILCISINEAKMSMMEISFSSHKNHSHQKAKLKKVFPYLIGFIDYFKKSNGTGKKGHSCFAISLQQIESTLFIDTLLPALKEHGLKCLPKHDSLIVDADKLDEAMELITSILDGIGFRYHFKNSKPIQKINVPEEIPSWPDFHKANYSIVNPTWKLRNEWEELLKQSHRKNTIHKYA